MRPKRQLTRLKIHCMIFLSKGSYAMIKKEIYNRAPIDKVEFL